MFNEKNRFKLITINIKSIYQKTNTEYHQSILLIENKRK